MRATNCLQTQNLDTVQHRVTDQIFLSYSSSSSSSIFSTTKDADEGEDAIECYPEIKKIEPYQNLRFTLIELLIVLSILAIVASGSVVIFFGGTEVMVSENLAQSEMAAIKRAIEQFKEDTGFLPGQGPFALDIDGGAVPTTVEPFAVPSEAWFKSPANFFQLFIAPVDQTGAEILPWSIENGRGWRGPYLTTDGNGRVDIGDNLGQDGRGDPTRGSHLENVYGIADPYVSEPVNGLLEWQSYGVAVGDPEPYFRWGRPYLLFDLLNQNARIVSMGPNHVYDGGADQEGSDDIQLDLNPR